MRGTGGSRLGRARPQDSRVPDARDRFPAASDASRGGARSGPRTPRLSGSGRPWSELPGRAVRAGLGRGKRGFPSAPREGRSVSERDRLDRVQDTGPGVAGAPGERLQKFLARAGMGSRRHCEGLIVAGRVRVNGQAVTTLGTRIRPGRDRVQVDGEVAHAKGLVTIMLHKPSGYITSRSDPQGRPVVTSLLPQGGLPPLFPVGRLDWDTEGLLLLTNDGDLAHALTHPRYGVRKVYHAKVKGHPSPESLARLVQGVVCDGEPLRALGARVMHLTRENAWVAITIEQGRYRQIRRMCEAIGHSVLKLIRVALGPVNLGFLPRGKWRPLSPAELRELQALRPEQDPSAV